MSQTGAGYVSSRLAYVEVVVSISTALGLLFITVIQLMYRSSRRHRSLDKAKRQIRFHGAHFLEQSRGDKRRQLVERGMEEYRYRITNPPQYNRKLPNVITNGRDAKLDCRIMLTKVRDALGRTYGRNVGLMSMRCCLSSVHGVLHPGHVTRFVQVYENVLFCQNRSGSSMETVTEDDLKFLYAFFYNKVMPELLQ